MFAEAKLKNTTTQGIIEYYSSQIERCINSKHLKLGRLLHTHLIKTSLHLNIFLANRLIDMYAKCGSTACAQSAFNEVPAKNDHSWNTLLSAYSRSGQLDHARRLFDEMSTPNLVSYNSLISGLTHFGFHREALQLFSRMQKQYVFGIVMDKFTIVGVTGACAGLADLDSLRQFHGAIVLTGLEPNQIMCNTLIDSYGKCGDVDSSRLVFDQMPARDVVSWTSLLGAYARESRLEEARWVFDRMPTRNSVSWTSLITGYAQNGHGEIAMDLFKQMMEEKINLTPFTFVSVLSTCASLALIGHGQQLHGFITRRSPGSDQFNVFICNALIDMYAKCGDMASAMALFEKMPERDTVSWNTILMGFALNGQGKQTLAIYEEMIRYGFKPNHVTFLGLLSACSHAGLLLEGCRYLDSMVREYGVRPRPEIYAVFIDLLGRNCQLEEAVNLIESMSFGDGLNKAGAWGALLSACRVHGNLNLARKAAESLFKLEPSNGARYVLLSNIYAAAGQWEDARHMRRIMKVKGLRKEVAHSWIEIRNARYSFVAEDKSHCQTEEIYQILTRLADQMKDSGDYPPSKQRLVFIPDEEEDVLDRLISPGGIKT